MAHEERFENLEIHLSRFIDVEIMRQRHFKVSETLLESDLYLLTI